MPFIPICPLMSAGNSVEIVCAQEKCAWYLKNLNWMKYFFEALLK